MHAFDYHRPTTIKEAVSLLRKVENAKLLAGGQIARFRPSSCGSSSPAALVDLGAIEELRGIKLDGGTLTIGALTRHAEVAASKDVAIGIPALARLADGIGDRQVRNQGTLGGSLANNDPAADYPAAVLGLGATINTNKRAIAADKFFTGIFETALKPGEIITSVSFPLPKRAAYVKFRKPASRFALVGVFVSEGDRQRAGRGDRRGRLRVPREGHGEAARREVRAGCDRQSEDCARRPQLRHARERRVPGAPHFRHRAAGGGSRPRGEVRSKHLTQSRKGAKESYNSEFKFHSVLVSSFAFGCFP